MTVGEAPHECHVRSYAVAVHNSVTPYPASTKDPVNDVRRQTHTREPNRLNIGPGTGLCGHSRPGLPDTIQKRANRSCTT